MTTLEADLETERVASAVIDSAFAVHKALGPGFLEGIYEEALAVEMAMSRLDFVRQHPVPLTYRGRSIGEHRLDFLVAGRVVLELKAVESLLDIHKAQVLSYLRATDLPVGLLFNFNVPMLKNGMRRIIHEPSRLRSDASAPPAVRRGRSS